MKTSFRGHILLLLAVIILSASACKSTKKAKEAAAAKARMEQEAADKKKQEDLAMKEAEEKARMEEQASREKEERLKKEEEEKAKANTPTSQKLQQYFASIAGASSVTAANSSIQEALTLFASDQTPVLIVISEEGGQKDYDKPTTIKDYLNYLKDQKKNVNRIGNVELDASGKIKELELKK